MAVQRVLAVYAAVQGELDRRVLAEEFRGCGADDVAAYPSVAATVTRPASSLSLPSTSFSISQEARCMVSARS